MKIKFLSNCNDTLPRATERQCLDAHSELQTRSQHDGPKITPSTSCWDRLVAIKGDTSSPESIVIRRDTKRLGRNRVINLVSTVTGGAETQDRTGNLRMFSLKPSQLSYRGYEDKPEVRDTEQYCQDSKCEQSNRPGCSIVSTVCEIRRELLQNNPFTRRQHTLSRGLDVCTVTNVGEINTLMRDRRLFLLLVSKKSE